jgi:hypothetical protein
MEDYYYDDAEMPGSRLNIEFDSHIMAIEELRSNTHIPFREGRGCQEFHGQGVCEGDRRVTRCDITRIMNWDQLIKYLGEVWDEMWGAMLFKLKAVETNMP